MTAFADTIPIALLTGFLGSGKSTLLNGLLTQSGMADTVVVVNEIGEIGIDNLLIEQVVEGVTLLTSGCICCSVRTDLEATLRDLCLKRVRGVIPAFKRMVIETTGLARPGPIVQTLFGRPVREQHYEVTSIVTTVDALHGDESLSRFAEAIEQAAVADTLILTKTDLSDPSSVAALTTRLRAINPLADILCVARGRAEHSEVLGQSFVSGIPLNPFTERSNFSQHRLSIPAIGGHSSDLRTDCFLVDQPVDWDVLEKGLKNLMADHGPRLLRFKSLLRVRGIDQPVALHGVHHTLYPPDLLENLQIQDSKLVFISQGISREVFEALVASLSLKS